MVTAALQAPSAPPQTTPATSRADPAASLLRFVTCGSVDDGKSTLIGRLLHDVGALFDDQLASLTSDSSRFGTRGEALDFALLVDGLAAEREQGITIDVAYRYFSSATRRFIVADAPGHEQYTRNMVTAASTADLAILLVDATRGLTEQTRRHARIVRLLGVGAIVVAVNKMDRVAHDAARFDEIVAAFAKFAAAEGIADFAPVPVVAISGSNITRCSAAMPWYRGPTLIELLNAAPGRSAAQAGGFAMPVQWVNRPNERFRGYAGSIARGGVRRGDPVVVLPGGAAARVARIVTFDGDLDEAAAGAAVTLVLDRDVDCAAGAVLAARGDRPAIGDRLTADLVWFDGRALVPDKRYLLQVGSARVPAWIDRVTARLDGAATGEGVAINAIATVELRCTVPVVALLYADNAALGAFILIDPDDNATAAAGMVRAIDRERRHGGIAEITPGPIYAFADDADGAARAVARLRSIGITAALIDRATLRVGVTSDLPDGADAAEWRRAAAVAALMAEAGVTVALAIAPPEGAPLIGVPWPDDASDTGNWII